jgi:hypothetical protein
MDTMGLYEALRTSHNISEFCPGELEALKSLVYIDQVLVNLIYLCVTGSILMDTTVLYEGLRTSQNSRISPRRTRSVEVVGLY